MSLLRRNSDSQPRQGATRVAPEPPRRRRSRSRRWMAVGAVCAVLLLVLIQQTGKKPAPKPAVAEAPEEKAPPQPPEPRFEFYQELPAHRVGNDLTPEQRAELDRARALLAPQPPVLAAPVAAQAVEPVAEQALVVTPPAPVADNDSGQPQADASSPDARPFEGSLNELLETLRVPATTSFVLQAGSWGNPENAEAVRDQLIGRGMSATLETVQVGDKTWYRVLLGPYADKARAEADSRALQAAGFTPLLRRADP